MWDYVIGGVTLWATIFGLIMFYNGRVTRGMLGGIMERMDKRLERMDKRLERMDKRLELILKNQKRAARDHEVMISAFQKAFRSRSPKIQREK